MRLMTSVSENVQIEFFTERGGYFYRLYEAGKRYQPKFGPFLTMGQAVGQASEEYSFYLFFEFSKSQEKSDVVVLDSLSDELSLLTEYVNSLNLKDHHLSVFEWLAKNHYTPFQIVCLLPWLV